MDHIGIDVHKRESQICILAEGGELIERRIRTEPQRFAEALGGRRRASSSSPRPRASGLPGVSKPWAITWSWPTRMRLRAVLVYIQPRT